MAVSWTDKQQRFVEEYCVDFNATQAAIRAGYSEKTAGQMGYENLKKPEIAAAIEERLSDLAMSAAEATKRLADIARADIGDFFRVVGGALVLDVQAVVEDGGGVVSEVSFDADGHPEIKLYDAQRALKTILDAHGAFNHRQEIDVRTPEGIEVEFVGEMPEIQAPDASESGGPGGPGA